MAGASMNDIKVRIKSVSSTMQITKAMELVATSKLRKAKERVEASRPFYETLKSAIGKLINSAETEESIQYLKPSTAVNKCCYVIIGGDRGLAGGYNSNLFKYVSSINKENESICILPVGKKVLEHYTRKNYEIVSKAFGVTDDVELGDCIAISKIVAKLFKDSKIDRVELVYTKFVSMLSQIPHSETILPLSDVVEEVQISNAIFEESPEATLERVVPQYIAGLVYSAVCEAAASEHGARRTAMNSANKNAGEIIDTLVLKYNRARQAVITQEITEIVSGAEAL